MSAGLGINRLRQWRRIRGGKEECPGSVRGVSVFSLPPSSAFRGNPSSAARPAPSRILVASCGAAGAVVECSAMKDAARIPIEWDKEKIRSALRARASQGLALSYRAASESDSRLVDAARHHFGSYDAALREIGVDPDSVRKRIAWNKAKVIAALRDRQARGLELHVLAIAKTHTALQLAMTKQFGSHDAALVAAGIDPGSVRKIRPEWDQARIVAALRERRDKGLELNIGAIQVSHPTLGQALRKYFASHDRALEAAGP